VKVKYTPLPSQKPVFEDETSRVITHSAGLGSGKSYNLVMKLLKLSGINKNISGGLLCPAYSDFTRDMRPTIEEICDKNRIKFRFNKNEKSYFFPWSKAPMYVFTAEKPIAGPNLGWGGVNEFSLIEYDRIKEFMRRIRVPCKCLQVNMVGTPEDRHGWLEDFVEKYSRRSDFKLYFGDTSENYHVDKDYVSDLETQLDEQALKVFKSGQIVKLGGLYFYYSFDRTKNISEAAEFMPEQTVYCGMDFNVGKMAASFSHKIGDSQYVFDEMFLRGDSNTHTMAKAIIEKFPDHFRNKLIITCDASGNARKSAAAEKTLSDVAVLRSYGLNVRFKTVNVRLRKRQIHMNGMLFHGRIVINPKCKTLIKDMEKVQQLDDWTKDPGKEDLFGHMSDGLDYVIDYEHKSLDDIRKRPIQME
jgi:hypothetical protein